MIPQKEMSIPALDNYSSYQPTTSCFLDGRYVSLVLKNIKEFHKQPIFVNLELDEEHRLISSSIHGEMKANEGMNISRVVITSPKMAHSALVWIDTRSKSIVFSDVKVDTEMDAHSKALHKTVDVLLKEFFSHLKYSYSCDIAYVADIEDGGDTTRCGKFGFCNAYVIKQVLDYVAGRAFDPRDIRKFAAAVEAKYVHLLDPNVQPEVEYYRGGYGGNRGYGGRGYGGRRGYYGGAGLGLGLGVLGGVALGSAIASPYYAPYPVGYYY